MASRKLRAFAGPGRVDASNTTCLPRTFLQERLDLTVTGLWTLEEMGEVEQTGVFSTIAL